MKNAVKAEAAADRLMMALLAAPAVGVGAPVTPTGAGVPSRMVGSGVVGANLDLLEGAMLGVVVGSGVAVSAHSVALKSTQANLFISLKSISSKSALL